MPSLKLCLLVASTSVAAAACSDQAPLPSAPAALPAASSTVTDPFRLGALRDVVSSAQPPAVAQVGSDMTVRLIGRGALTNDAPAATRDEAPSAAAPTSGAALPNEPTASRPSSARFHLFNSATRNEFEVELSGRMLAELQRTGELAGFANGTPASSDLAAGEGLQPGRGRPTQALARIGGETAALSGGVDNRTLRTPTTTWPWRTVAQLSVGGSASDCTGTLIGPRHLITAAHCLVTAGTSNWRSMRVTPARDGLSLSPYGFSQLSLNDPLGRETWYFTPAEWRDPNVGNKQPYDWGLVVVPDRLGDRAGWQGYVALSAAKLGNASHFNRGYPTCDASAPDRPKNCETARMYGDANDCPLGTYMSPDADGWYREVSFGCDVSRGQDGSALYQNFFDPTLNANVSVVIAVMTRQACITTCTPSTEFAAWAHRLTPSDLSVITWLRQTFP